MFANMARMNKDAHKELRRFMYDKALTNLELAKMLGLTMKHVYNLKNNLSKMTLSAAYRLEQITERKLIIEDWDIQPPEITKLISHYVENPIPDHMLPAIRRRCQIRKE